MPPKRKRAEADTTAEGSTTRSTKKSSRTTRGDNGTPDVTDNASQPANSVEPPPKKTRALGKKNGRGSKVVGMDDEPLNSTANHDMLDGPKQASIMVEYTPQRARALFQKFTDDDDPNVIGPGGVEKLCREAGIPLEGAQTLILAWQFSAQEMAKLERSEWLKGTDALRVSSLPALAIALKELDELVVHDKEAKTPAPSLSSVKKREGVDEVYNRARYWQYASNRKAAFTELYQFSFNLSKPSQSRNVDIETAIALWSVLLAPRYPIITEFLEFLGENGSYKGANRDIWNMVHEFCQTVDGDFNNYEPDGAWPTMLDDFVEWKKAKTPRSKSTGDVSTPMDK